MEKIMIYEFTRQEVYQWIKEHKLIDAGEIKVVLLAKKPKYSLPTYNGFEVMAKFNELVEEVKSLKRKYEKFI